MIWNDHTKLEGTHAFLSASKHSWINWTDEQYAKRYFGKFSTEIGTFIHEFAKDCITARIKLTPEDGNTIKYVLSKINIPNKAYDAEHILSNLVPFVNDAIGYHMSPEILLYYSFYCYGTADAISFNEKEKILRIHDLKTGATATSMDQLLIYAALFCLEYKKNPKDFKTELRIYQSNEVAILIPEPEVIIKYMEIIKTGSQKIVDLLERNL